MDLNQQLGKQVGKGAIVGRVANSSDPFSAPHRDLGNCLHLILMEAVSATAAVYDGQEKEIEELDTITKMLLSIYKDSMVDNLQGISKFAELYTYLEEQDSEVYSTFTSFVLQSIFCYLFTVRELAIGLPPELNQDVFDHNAVLIILSSLDQPLQTEVLEAFRSNGRWPARVDHAKLLRRLDPYLDTIAAQQAAQYKKMEEAENVGSKEQ